MRNFHTKILSNRLKFLVPSNSTFIETTVGDTHFGVLQVSFGNFYDQKIPFLVNLHIILRSHYRQEKPNSFKFTNNIKLQRET
jgi:hypothetical protein